MLLELLLTILFIAMGAAIFYFFRLSQKQCPVVPDPVPCETCLTYAASLASTVSLPATNEEVKSQPVIPATFPTKFSRTALKTIWAKGAYAINVCLLVSPLLNVTKSDPKGYTLYVAVNDKVLGVTAKGVRLAPVVFQAGALQIPVLPEGKYSLEFMCLWERSQFTSADMRQGFMCMLVANSTQAVLFDTSSTYLAPETGVWSSGVWGGFLVSNGILS